MTTWPEARHKAHTTATPLPPTKLPLAEALGATLATPLTTHTPMPAFDTAAMDGYAVAGEPPWTVIGEILAGRPPLPRQADNGPVHARTPRRLTAAVATPARPAAPSLSLHTESRRL